MKQKILIFAFAMIVLVFLSGVGVGVVGRRAAEPVRFHSILVEELDLSPQQRKQIEQIWSKTMEDAPRPPISEIEKAEAQRQAQIDHLLTPQQRIEYQKIQDQFEARLRELDAGSRAKFADAEEQTKRLLTPEQRKKYEQLLARPKRQVLVFRHAGPPSTQPKESR